VTYFGLQKDVRQSRPTSQFCDLNGV